jgi:hypothetical protein
MNDKVAQLSQNNTTPCPDEAEDRANRVLLQLVRLTHAMTEKERELALVLLQSVSAWNGLSQKH